MMKKITAFFTRPIVLLLLGSFLLRIGLASFGTLTLDQNTFIAWGHNAAAFGLSKFYEGWSDYLPGYIYILWLLAKLEVILPISPIILYKLPAIFADISAGILVYEVTRKLKNEKAAILGASLVLLNPAFLANSTFWGQVDMLTALFSVLSIVFYKRPIVSSFFLAVGALMKPQAALAAPVVLFLMISNKIKVQEILFYIFLSGSIFLLGFLPFANGKNLLLFAVERLNVTLGQYPYTSINSFNFWGLWGFWQKESEGLLSEKNIGYLLLGVTSLISYIKLSKVKERHFLFLAILFLGNFLFFTRMHERHLLPTLLPLAIFSAIEPILLIPFLVLSITYVFNMYYSYIWITENFKSVFSNPVIVMMILLNILSVLVIVFHPTIKKYLLRMKVFIMSKATVKNIKKYIVSIWNQKNDPKLPSLLDQKKGRYLLYGIILFALISRTIGLANPDHEYFDEVYHAFTARAMLNGNEKAWEWWNENPAGFAYEWTHPPFAKEAMVVGMLLFGENSFGWRIPAAIFGTGVVFLIYKLGERLFNRDVGLLSAAVFALDGLGLVLSRIGMNDIYLVFFLLLSFLLFFNEKYFWSALALGFAAATKWTTFWFFPVLFALQLLRGKGKPKDLISLAIPPILFFGGVSKLEATEAGLVAVVLGVSFLIVLAILRKRMGVAFFLFLPLVIYFLSYIPMFLSGHSWDIFWGMQRQMWWYHTNLVATHPYESTWWGWPLLLRPLWLYTSGITNNTISNIYAMGNPIIFWGGFISIIASVIYSIKEKRKNLLLIVLAYGAVFVPWALSPRIMFLYHYFPAIPFLALATGFVLHKNKTFIAPFLLLSLVIYIYFYPHWTALPVPTWLDTSYYWLPGWR